MADGLPVTGNATRQARYRQSLESLGLVKIELIVPRSSVPEFRSMAVLCKERPDLVPWLMRDGKTGRAVKA